MSQLASDIISWFKTLIKTLLLSVYSIKFYRDVYRTYIGYGLKYIFTISFFSAFLVCFIFVDKINNVKLYLAQDIISSKVANIDHIISQFPDLNYDGSRLGEGQDIIFLTDLNNKAVVAIDPKNQLSKETKNKLPFVFTSQKLLVSLIDITGKVIYSSSLDYNMLFGNEPLIVNQALVKSIIFNILDKFSTLLIYIGFPLICLLRFIYAIFEKCFIIVIIYFLSKMLNIEASLKTCVRLIFFASGVFFLLQPLTFLLFPNLNFIALFIQTWCNILMIIGILRSNNKLNRFS